MQRRGFSLVELAIVLVIISLITGVIVVGQSMIATSQMHAVASQVESYRTAMMAFSDKYQCLPGDCPHAVSFGLGTGGGAGANGKGDGIVFNGDWAGPYPAQPAFESYNVWYHLAAARLTEGGYRGWVNQVSTVAGTDFPITKPRRGGIWFTAVSNATTATRPNSFWIIADLPSGRIGGDTISGVLKPSESEMIDIKLDDGVPNSGNVKISNPSSLYFVEISDPTDAIYSNTANTTSCGINTPPPARYNPDGETPCMLQIKTSF